MTDHTILHAHLTNYLSGYIQIDIADDLAAKLSHRLPESHRAGWLTMLANLEATDNAAAREESWSYREYEVKYGSEEYRAWEQWMKAHNIPLQQVPFRGWAARDVTRNTVSVLLFDWNVEDDSRVGMGQWQGFYVDRDDDGLPSRSKDARYRVYTAQLPHKPLPFPNSNPGMQSAYTGEDNVGSR